MQRPNPLLARSIKILIFCAATLALVGCVPDPARSGEDVISEASLIPCFPSVEIGVLETELIMESSGMEISPRFPDRVYHINDSGDAGRFYITDLNGANTQTVLVEDFDPIDTEDIAIGDCGPGDGTCLFIGDIGDNLAARGDVEIVVVEEREQYPSTVAPLHRIRLRYPEGPQDAESLAVHPEGDLYIVTKRANYDERTANPSMVYRLQQRDWLAADGTILTAELIAELDLTAISSDIFSGSLPTAADIHDDGTRLLLLTYASAFEFSVDFSSEGLKFPAEMVVGVDYREIEIETLEQQESVAYIPENNAFLYETESVRFGTSPPEGTLPRLMRVDCAR